MHIFKVLLQLFALQLFLLPNAAASINAKATFGYSSEESGPLPLDVTIKSSRAFPEEAIVLIDLGSNNADCSRLVDASLPLMSSGGCEIIEGVFNLRTSSDELPAKTEIKFVFEQINHVNRQLATFEVKVTTTQEIGASVKKFSYFLLQPAENVYTCQTLDVTLVAGLTHAVGLNSLVEITFGSGIDISGILTIDLENFQKTENTITGNTVNAVSYTHLTLPTICSV
eukprot:TRINITY_DN11597_c0_g1_i2.p1 TRINITY_DN11597_c0_g1~~TRINITY_DN11597_c0_g1_i2.p1  ORF type:complete len:227 (-),score=42.89 TRINITY_DN11597_c0_g1_i2:14-694(-)